MTPTSLQKWCQNEHIPRSSCLEYDSDVSPRFNFFRYPVICELVSTIIYQLLIRSQAGICNTRENVVISQFLSSQHLFPGCFMEPAPLRGIYVDIRLTD